MQSKGTVVLIENCKKCLDNEDLKSAVTKNQSKILDPLRIH